MFESEAKKRKGKWLKNAMRVNAQDGNYFLPLS